MLCAVSLRRLRTVIVLIFLLLIIVVYLNYESHEENNEPPVKDPPLIKSPKPILIATTEEYEYEEIPIIPSWGEFIPTDARYEKDIFFLETRG